MIYTDNLNEFVGIEILKSYCSNINEENDCEYCKLKEFCDCMPLAPFKLKLKYIPQEKDLQEPQNKDTGELTAKASMEQRTFTSIDEMINAGPKTKKKINTGGILCSLSDKKTDENVVNQIQEGLSKVMQDKLSKELKMDIKK